MNRIFGVMLSAALLAGAAGAAFADTTTDAKCDTQLHAQLQTLQQQLAALQSAGDVQPAPATGFQLQTGG